MRAPSELRGPCAAVAIALTAACSSAAPTPAAPPPAPTAAPTAAPTDDRPALAPPPESVDFVLQDPIDGDVFSLSPDGKLLAACRTSGLTMQIFSVPLRKLVARFALPPQGCGTTMFWPRSSLAMMGSRELCAWDLAHAPGVECTPLEAAWQTVWSPNHGFLLARQTGAIRVLDVATTKSVREIPAPSPSTFPAAVSESGKLVATREKDRNDVWLEGASEPDPYPKGNIAFSRDDRFAVIVSNDGGQVFDLATKQVVKEIGVTRAAWGPEGSRLALIDATKKLSVWDPTRGEIPIAPATNVAYPLWLNADRLAFVDATARMSIFDVTTGATLDLGATAGLVGVRASWPSPDGSVLVARVDDLRVVDTKTGALRVVQAEDPKRLDVSFRDASSPIALIMGDAIRALDLGRNPPVELGSFLVPKTRPRFQRGTWVGDLLVTGCGNGLLALRRDDASTSYFANVGANGYPLTSDHAGHLAMSIGGEIVVHDPKRGVIARERGNAGTLDARGQLLATWESVGATVTKVRVTAIANAALVAEIPLVGSISAVRFSPSGRGLAIVANGFNSSTTIVYDLANARVVKRFPLNVDSPSWSPDGTMLATHRSDETVEIWDTSSWKRVSSFKGHAIDGASFSWSPDGKKLLADGLVAPKGGFRVWGGAIVDLAGNELARLGGVRDGRWLPDSSGVVGRSGRAIRRVRIGAPHTPTTNDDVVLRSSFNASGIVAGGTVAQVFDGSNRTALVRLSDGVTVWLDVAEKDGKCGLFAFDEEGHFDGDTLDRVTYRIGDDLRAARIDASQETLDAHRRPGLLASFFADDRDRSTP